MLLTHCYGIDGNKGKFYLKYDFKVKVTRSYKNVILKFMEVRKNRRVNVLLTPALSTGVLWTLQETKLIEETVSIIQLAIDQATAQFLLKQSRYTSTAQNTQDGL